ncbi:MAG TPA: TIGR03013 family XrtA/PEP-CTERM system glycosyltransferase [Burkholderiales bacterium]|nr:TIGR03013 family XrtA/PEP-CTERM system glycosyltransferase [Burkholderiales bacterium]
MVNLFRHYVPLATILQLALEAGLFFAAILLAVMMQTHSTLLSSSLPILPAFAFAALMVCVNSALGLYRRDSAPSFSHMAPRLLVALLIGFPLAYALFSALPHGGLYQDALGYTVLLVLAGLLILRRVLSASILGGTLLSRRVLILGTGADALAVDQALMGPRGSGYTVVGFYPISNNVNVSVPQHRVLQPVESLQSLIRYLAVDEVIVAVREQRGGVVPMSCLLNCRLEGVRVTDLPGFYERVRGEVPIESLKASWLIYGEGFRQGRMRNIVKRAFDVATAGTLLVLTFPLMVLVALTILFEGGGAVIYRQERVGRGGRPFTVYKFRSMVADAEGDGQARWAQTNDPRVTAFGKFIRRTRMDELPQLWNVLKGEMSFVGPRPERPQFVGELEQSIPYYGARHSVKPGLTGWAQVRYSYGASVEDATRKLQFDLYYVKNHSLFLDLLVLVETVRVVLWGEGAR